VSCSVYTEFGYEYATAEFAPFEFELKSTPEDFLVEELPLYSATGSGDHLLIRVEKRGLTTLQAISQLARALGLKPRDFGYAGLKDRHALTRQTFSVEHVEPERVLALDIEGLRILSVDRHASKLRLGHLAGNRFELLLRGLDPSELDRLQQCLDVMAESGLPNWFGEQRFGRHANGHHLGRRLLAQEWPEYFVDALLGAGIEESEERLFEMLREKESGALMEAAKRVDRDLVVALRQVAGGGSIARAVRTVPKPVRSLQLSALQSYLFNALLAERLRRPAPWRLEAGDVAWIHAKGACFVVDGTEEDLEARVRSFELSPAGPLFGARLLRAAGAVGAAEEDLLATTGLSHEAFGQREARLRGARRPYRVPVRDLSLENSGQGPLLRFTLPKGSYATSLVEELRKRVRSADSRREFGRSEPTGPDSASS
jgi:tRNA pseudouridine13 synthase